MKHPAVRVCNGRSCQTFGGERISQILVDAKNQGALPNDLNISPCPCVGPCSSAPNVVVGQTLLHHVTPDEAVSEVKRVLMQQPLEDPDARETTTRTGLSAEDIMTANNFLGDL